MVSLYDLCDTHINLLSEISRLSRNAINLIKVRRPGGGDVNIAIIPHTMAGNRIRYWEQIASIANIANSTSTRFDNNLLATFYGTSLD